MSSGKSGGDTPRIYVADLAAYNSGRLHGAWVDATLSPDEIQEEIQKILRSSPEPDAEEWAIHDYENFGGLQLSESEDMEKISQVANLIKEHGPLFAEVVSHFGGVRYLDDAVEAMAENYQGEFDVLADWAERFAEDTGAPPETYQSYIDWERVGNDLDGKVHVFFSR